MFIFRSDWGSFLFAVAVSTSGYDFHNPSWQSQSSPELPLVPGDSWVFPSSAHAEPKTTAAMGFCCFPSALGKAHTALMAVSFLVNTCTPPCEPSPAMWSLPGRHGKLGKLLIATMYGAANNTEQKAWGVANHHQMTFSTHSHECILG